MPEPTIGIWSEVQLLTSKLRAQVKEASRIMSDGLKSAPLKVQIEPEVKPEAWAKLQTKLAGMKLTVPVQFVPSGVMPGLPGGGGGGGVPSPVSPGGFNPRNFWLSYYGRQMMGGRGFTKALDGAIADADESYAAAVAADTASRLAKTVSGGGGRASSAFGSGRGGLYGYFNPFGPRGLARILGSGVAGYGILEAMHLATGFMDANNTESHPERFLREMNQLGSQHSAYADTFLQGQASSMAGISASEERFKSVEGIPLLGSLARLVDSATGASRALSDLKGNVEDVTKIHEYAQSLGDENAARRAALTHDPIAILAQKHEAEAQKDLAAEITAERAVEKANYGSATYRRARKAQDDLKEKNAERAEFRQQEMAQAVGEFQNQLRTAGIEVTSSVRAMGIVGATGDPFEVMRRRQAADLERTAAQYDARIGDPNASPGQRIAAFLQKPFKILEMKSQQEQEMNQLLASREKMEKDSDARVQSIRDEANEKLLRSTGQTYNAEVAAAKRATDEKVAQLEREAKAVEQTDAKRAKGLRDQALAEREAGRAAEQALQIEHARQAAIAAVRANVRFQVAGLETGGQNRAARDAKLDADYRERVQEIQNRNEPDMLVQLHDAALDYAGQKAKNNRADQLAARSLTIQTADAKARAVGQSRVGEALEMQSQFEDMERDAANDPRRARQVRDFENAKLAEFRRSLRPPPQIYRGTGLHDSILEGFSREVENTQALKLVDSVQKNLGKAGFDTRAGKNVDPAKSLNDAADKFNKVADKILESQPLYLVGQ